MGRRSTDDRDRWSTELGTKVLGASMQVSRRRGWLAIVTMLGACWIVTMLFGGAAVVPAHYFYVPILFAGVRFGALGSFVTAVAAALLAGPLTYADTATRTPQTLTDWGLRGVFFVVIGQVLTAMAGIAASAREAELADLRMAKRLSAALDESRLVVFFQPIVSLSERGRLLGAEALVRLDDPPHGLIGPADFIPSAERSGMIRPLGEHVLRTACRQVVAWIDEGLVDEDFTLSVNVSPRQLDAVDFADRVGSVLAATGLDPARLQLEITETCVAEHRGRFLDALHSLRRLGVELALDDFGTGHSTLAEVQQLPIDVIKVDRQFVATLCSGGDAIVTNVVDLARSVGMSTIAEGVETPEQERRLAALRCEAAQGYLYGAPVSSDEFALRLVASPVDRTSPGPR
jgi:EAL domain-containing protein (putative c-di-GMP-specific phosphodiesterase class I)